MQISLTCTCSCTYNCADNERNIRCLVLLFLYLDFFLTIHSPFSFMYITEVPLRRRGTGGHTHVHINGKVIAHFKIIHGISFCGYYWIESTKVLMCLNACKMAVFNHSAYMLMAQWCAEDEGEEEEERRKEGEEEEAEEEEITHWTKFSCYCELFESNITNTFSLKTLNNWWNYKQVTECSEQHAMEKYVHAYIMCVNTLTFLNHSLVWK